MKFLLIDHHALFREGLRHILQQLPGGAGGILEAGSFADGLKLAGQNPDVALILLELNSPGSNGAISVKLLRQFYPHISVVVVSSTEDPRSRKLAMDYGASGFVGKSSTVPALLRILHLALARRAPQLAANETKRSINTSECGLTPRQMNVLKCLAEGLSNREIAKRIDLAEGTVKLHVSAVYRALRINNRMEAKHFSSFFDLTNTNLPCA